MTTISTARRAHLYLAGQITRHAARADGVRARGKHGAARNVLGHVAEQGAAVATLAAARVHARLSPASWCPPPGAGERPARQTASPAVLFGAWIGVAAHAGLLGVAVLVGAWVAVGELPRLLRSALTPAAGPAALSAWALAAAPGAVREARRRCVAELGPFLVRGGTPGWHIPGDVVLTVPDLDTLPPRLVIDGDLTVHCAQLATLGEGLDVGGDLFLGGCPALVALGPGHMVRGSLHAKGLTELRELGAGLTVGGLCDLDGCTGLAGLPAGLRVGGELSAQNCVALAHVGDGLSVDGGVDLSGCRALAALPESARLRGSLRVSGCTSLRRLPRVLVLDELLAVGCHALESLGETVRVTGLLQASDCRSLRTTPPDFADLAEAAPMFAAAAPDAPAPTAAELAELASCLRETRALEFSCSRSWQRRLICPSG